MKHTTEEGNRRGKRRGQGQQEEDKGEGKEKIRRKGEKKKESIKEQGQPYPWYVAWVSLVVYISCAVLKAINQFSCILRWMSRAIPLTSLSLPARGRPSCWNCGRELRTSKTWFQRNVCGQREVGNGGKKCLFVIDDLATALSATRCTLSTSCQFVLFYLCLVDGVGRVICLFAHFCMFFFSSFKVQFWIFANFFSAPFVCEKLLKWCITGRKLCTCKEIRKKIGAEFQSWCDLNAAWLYARN